MGKFKYSMSFPFQAEVMLTAQRLVQICFLPLPFFSFFLFAVGQFLDNSGGCYSFSIQVEELLVNLKKKLETREHLIYLFNNHVIKNHGLISFT